MEPGGWAITITPPGKETRLPWGPEDFPQEALLPLLPLWARAGAPGREIVHNDINYPTLEIQPMVVRDEGKTPRRLTIFKQGEDKPYLTLMLDPSGAIEQMLWSNNLKAIRVNEKEGLALKAKFEKARKTPSDSP